MVNSMQNFVLFKVNSLNCALKTSDVQEIIRNSSNLTPVKRAPYFIDGVINLRGQIVSIINLSKLFGSDATDSSAKTIIVVNIEGEVYGFCITEMLDIVSEGTSEIEHSSVLPQDSCKEYVERVLSIDNQLYSLINPESVACPEFV